MKEEFEMKRTELAGYFADSGAALLAYMGSSSALAAIPDSEPPRYVVAGTPEEIVKLLPAAGAIAELVAAPTSHAQVLAEVREQALEEAAKKCESRGHLTMYGEAAAKGCAREIRALKGAAAQSVESEKGGEA